MAAKTLMKILRNVPDEFFKWVQAVMEEVSGKFRVIEEKAKTDFHIAEALMPDKPTARIGQMK